MARWYVTRDRIHGYTIWMGKPYFDGLMWLGRPDRVAVLATSGVGEEPDRSDGLFALFMPEGLRLADGRICKVFPLATLRFRLEPRRALCTQGLRDRRAR